MVRADRITRMPSIGNRLSLSQDARDSEFAVDAILVQDDPRLPRHMLTNAATSENILLLSWRRDIR